MILIKLILLYGGKSGEHEISLISAASVLQHLNPERYEIIPIGIDKLGRFYKNDYRHLLAYPKALPIETEGSCVLDDWWVNGRLTINADVIFPVLHGPLYEDGAIQGLLTLAEVAYVGCDVLSSAIGMNKDISRCLVKSDGIQTARYRVLPSQYHNHADIEQFCHGLIAEFGWPLFVKPCSMGSSVGIHKTLTREELRAAIADAARYDETILVEEYLRGREIEFAVLEHMVPTMPPKVSIAGEIKTLNHSDGFYSYRAKYLETAQTQLIAPAVLDETMLHRLQQASIEIFTRLKCKGMARVDFFVDDENGEFYFSEINTIPGFTSVSMYPRLWQLCGLSYSELLDHLIDLAIIHQRRRAQWVTDYQ